MSGPHWHGPTGQRAYSRLRYLAVGILRAQGHRNTTAALRRKARKVCAQVGNVNSGAIDPLGEICQLAHRHGARNARDARDATGPLTLLGSTSSEPEHSGTLPRPGGPSRLTRRESLGWKRDRG
jgi:hypothetical protein